jgi:hypothetical protein
VTEPRKHRFRSDDHETTARERRKKRRVRKQRRANLRDEAFGKINWDAYRHDQLWDMIKSAEPPKLGEQAYHWAKLAADIDTTTSDVRTLTQRLLLSWKGPSAVKAAGSVSALIGWAATAGKNARQVGDGLDAYTSAIGEAQRKMPEPVHYYAERWFREGYDVKALDGPNGAYLLDDLLDDHLPKKQEAERAKAEAVHVMEQYEAASKGVHTALPPAFDEAPPVTSDSTPRPSPVPGDTPKEAPPHTPSPASPAPGPHASNPVPRPATDTVGEDTTAASVAPLGVGATAGYGTAGAGFGAGAGLPLGAGGVIGVLDDGGRVGWLPGGASNPANQGAAAAQARATPGGGYGMYPPGTGARREEDTEHRDRYADGYDLMDDLPPAYPPVFGE